MADILENLNITKEKKKREDLFLEKKIARPSNNKFSIKQKAEDEKLAVHTLPKQESGSGREFVLRLRMPKPIMIERFVYILIILILAYFAFFKDVSLSELMTKEVSGNATTTDKSLTAQKTGAESAAAGTAKDSVTKEAEEASKEIITTVTKEVTNTTAVATATQSEKNATELSGKIVVSITDVDTKETSYGSKKITGVSYSIENQKEKLTNAVLKIFIYDPTNADDPNKNRERDSASYSIIPVSTTKISGEKSGLSVPSIGNDAYRVEVKLYDKANKLLAQDYKVVDIS